LNSYDGEFQRSNAYFERTKSQIARLWMPPKVLEEWRQTEKQNAIPNLTLNKHKHTHLYVYADKSECQESNLLIHRSRAPFYSLHEGKKLKLIIH
jgi:hypothetical protein